MAKTKKAPAKRPAAKKTAPKRAAPAKPAAPIVSAALPVAEARGIPVSRLHPSPLNPRKTKHDDETVRALLGSIVAKGVLQSLLVRPHPKRADEFEIIAGEGRWRAAALGIREDRLAVTYELPCRVRACTDAELLVLAVTENMARAELPPMDMAEAIQAMRRHLKDDAIIAAIGIPERTFYRRAQLLRLAPALADDVRAGKLTLPQVAAYTLGTFKDQSAHRALKDDWHQSPEQIRAKMTRERVPVSRALFPVKDYDGEFLDDPDTGARWFLDKTLFHTLQNKAIKAKVATLKEASTWVEEINGWEQGRYPKAAKGDKTAGAIWWIDQAGEFHHRTGVAKKGTIRAAGSARGAPVSRPAAENAARISVVSHARAALMRAALADPVRGLAAAIADSLRYDRLELPTGAGACDSPEEFAAYEALAAAVAPFVGAAGKSYDEIGEALYGLDDSDEQDEARAARLFHALMALDLRGLIAIAAALECERLGTRLQHGGIHSPLGMLLLQRELPLEAAAAADERAIAGKWGDQLAGAEAAS